MYGWINDCAYYSDDSKQTEYGWAQILGSLEAVKKEESTSARNSLVVRYSNYDGIPCEALKKAKKGDCLLIKGRFSLHQETEGSISITGEAFEILASEE